MSKHRDWCFTAWEEPEFNEKKMVYMIYQMECCPTTGKHHFQGYVECKNSMRLNEIKKILPDKSHIETRKGSQRQAINYCCKDETRIGETKEFGDPKIQGHRSDMDGILEAVEQGRTTKEILKEFGGKALRILGCIRKAQLAINDLDSFDELIEKKRVLNELMDEINFMQENAAEVNGNTGRSLLAEKNKECMALMTEIYNLEKTIRNRGF